MFVIEREPEGVAACEAFRDLVDRGDRLRGQLDRVNSPERVREIEAELGLVDMRIEETHARLGLLVGLRALDVSVAPSRERVRRASATRKGARR